MVNDLLHDDIIRLRAIEAEDIDCLFKWENDTSIWLDGCSMAPYSRKTIWEYIETYTPDIYKTNQLRLIIVLTSSETAIGTIDLYDFDYQNRRAGVGILIDKEYRGLGYATRSLNIICRYAGEFLGLHQLWSTIGSENRSSLKLFKNCGFSICGRMHSWIRRGKSYSDAYILQKFID